jgi:hypothetical protein
MFYILYEIFLKAREILYISAGKKIETERPDRMYNIQRDICSYPGLDILNGNVRSSVKAVQKSSEVER